MGPTARPRPGPILGHERVRKPGTHLRPQKRDRVEGSSNKQPTQKPQAANPKNSVKDTQQNKIHNMFAAFNDSDEGSYDSKLDFPELTDTGATKTNEEIKK
mgnify:CR=1 FL=1